MSILSRYLRYLNDNPQRYWFKRKAYGWGWVPAMWQGWLVLAAFILILPLILVPFLQATRAGEPAQGDVVWFLVRIALWVAGMIGTCYLTGEPPRWQWGIPEDGDGA